MLNESVNLLIGDIIDNIMIREDIYIIYFLSLPEMDNTSKSPQTIDMRAILKNTSLIEFIMLHLKQEKL